MAYKAGTVSWCRLVWRCSFPSFLGIDADVTCILLG